jgi:hypothetical protein
MNKQTITGTRNFVNRVIPIKPRYPSIKSTNYNTLSTEEYFLMLCSGYKSHAVKQLF